MKFLETGFDCQNFTGLHNALGMILRCFFYANFYKRRCLCKRKESITLCQRDSKSCTRNQKKEENMENLLYTPKLPKGFEEENFNVDEWLQMVEENEKKIKELDEKAKTQGSVLYRFLYEPVADGIGVYQIIKVNKKSCRIRYCSTNGFNEYLVRQWGETATVPMQYVLNAIGGRIL